MKWKIPLCSPTVKRGFAAAGLQCRPQICQAQDGTGQNTLRGRCQRGQLPPCPGLGHQELGSGVPQPLERQLAPSRIPLPRRRLSGSAQTGGEPGTDPAAPGAGKDLSVRAAEHRGAARRYTSRLEGTSPAGRSRRLSRCKQCGHRQRLGDGYKKGGGGEAAGAAERELPAPALPCPACPACPASARQLPEAAAKSPRSALSGQVSVCSEVWEPPAPLAALAPRRLPLPALPGGARRLRGCGERGRGSAFALRR